MEYSDHLDENGEPVHQGHTDYYMASGNGTEFFCNKFNYHGFRFVKISNLRKAPDIRAIKAHLIHTDFEVASAFSCSDQDLNRIHDMVAYTLRCLSLGGYLVDCPQLERLGYGGDGNASTVTAQTMFHLAPLYSNWLNAWKDVIREDGGMPHTAPNPYAAGGGPYWCGFIISASWHTYQNYGDTRVLETYYPIMQQWLSYVEQYRIDGLLKRWPNTDYRNWYLGDWASPKGTVPSLHTDDRSIDLVNNCYLSVCFDQMGKIAITLGKESDSYDYFKRKKQLNQKIHETFFNEGQKCYATGSQIDCLFPIIAGAVPKEMEEALIAFIIRRTEREYGGHLNTGLVGVPVMMEWATKKNCPDFIYSMLKKKTFPGYLHMLEKGATTTWEHWNGERSRIHNCYNGVGQWFYQSIGGIRQIEETPAYKEFLIDPQIPEGITWAKTQIETPYGLIQVDWALSGNRMDMNIVVPMGSKAHVLFPQSSTDRYIDKRSVVTSEKEAVLGSGKYHISYAR